MVSERRIGIVASVGAARAICGTLGALKALDENGLKVGREIVAIEGASGGGISAPVASVYGIDKAIELFSNVTLENFVERIYLWEERGWWDRVRKYLAYGKFLTWDQAFHRGVYAFDGDGGPLLGTLKRWCLDADIRYWGELPLPTELIGFDVSPRPGKQRFNQWLSPEIPAWIPLAATANMAFAWKVRWRNRRGVVHHYKDGGATDEIPLDEAFDWMPYSGRVPYRDWFNGEIRQGEINGPGVNEIIVITPLNVSDPQKRSEVEDLDKQKFAFFQMLYRALSGLHAEDWEDNLDPLIRAYVNPNVKVRLLPIRGLWASLGKPQEWGDQIKMATDIAHSQMSTWTDDIEPGSIG